MQVHKNRRSLCIFTLLTAVALAGCANHASNNGTKDPDLMATVNGYNILRSEFDKAYSDAAPQGPESDGQELLRLKVLNEIISRRLFLQRAQKLGLGPGKDEVESKINQYKAPYTREQFAKVLIELGLTEKELELKTRQDMTIDMLFKQEIDSQVMISDQDIQNYYNGHRAQFNVTEPQYDLAQIYVSSRPDGPSGGRPGKAQNDVQARDKIKMVHNRLESGEDFAPVAAAYSEDQDTAHSGGELGSIPQSRLKNTDSATREAVLKLKPGEFTEVIRVTDPASQKVVGYRIVKLLSKQAAVGQLTLADTTVKDSIRTKLNNEREQVLRAAYDEVLRSGAEIHNYYAERVVKNHGRQ